MPSPSSEERRTFLRYALLLIAGILALTGSWGLGRFALFWTRESKTREVPLDIVDKLQVGSPVHVPQAGAWLVKQKEDGPLLAFDDRCTHLGCRQKWDPARKRYQCPCHGSEFDIEGNVKRGPATRPMPRLFVSRKGERTLRLLEKPPKDSSPVGG